MAESPRLGIEKERFERPLPFNECPEGGKGAIAEESKHAASPCQFLGVGYFCI